MRIVILGCGRVGSTIAGNMAREGHSVTIIDQDPDAFRRLAPDFSGKTLVGNGIDEDTLARADAGSADAFVAVTNGDNRNIMSVQIAKERFNVPKVIARIYDPIRSAAYAEMGINTICTTCVGAGIMRDMILDQPFGPMETYLKYTLDSAMMEDTDE